MAEKAKTIRVRMRTLASGPEGIMRPGRTYDIDAGQAKELIEGGYAEAVKGAAPETASMQPPEKAVSRRRAKE